MFQHHIILATPEMMESELVHKWYDFVKTYGPEGIVSPYTTVDGDVAIEYGTRESDMPHCYIIPLHRDLTTDETQFIVATWEHIYPEDFDIEKWNKLFELPLFDYVENYSTGMKKKLAFIGIIAMDRSILILDEPFNV
mgnify:CR=1 FL=1